MEVPDFLGSAVIGAVIAALFGFIYGFIREERQRSFDRASAERKRRDERQQRRVVEQRDTLDQLQHALSTLSSSSLWLLVLRHMPPELWAKDGNPPLDAEWQREFMSVLEAIPILVTRIDDETLQQSIRQLNDLLVRIVKEEIAISEVPAQIERVGVPLREAQRRAGEIYRNLDIPD